MVSDCLKVAGWSLMLSRDCGINQHFVKSSCDGSFQWGDRTVWKGSGRQEECLLHLLSRKIHKKYHSQDDDEVKDHQLVHFLSNLGLPALKPKRLRENETWLGAEKARLLPMHFPSPDPAACGDHELISAWALAHCGFHPCRSPWCARFCCTVKKQINGDSHP